MMSYSQINSDIDLNEMNNQIMSDAEQKAKFNDFMNRQSQFLNEKEQKILY